MKTTHLLALTLAVLGLGCSEVMTSPGSKPYGPRRKPGHREDLCSNQHAHILAELR
jgi:hypothetical protein